MRTKTIERVYHAIIDGDRVVVEMVDAHKGCMPNKVLNVEQYKDFVSSLEISSQDQFHRLSEVFLSQ